MSQNPIERYIWLIDTLRQRGRLTRRQLSELWKLSPHCRNGEEFCRRTLYNYKNSIASLFDLDIEYDKTTYEYYINESRSKGLKFTDWLLNSAAVNEALSASADISDHILLEDVPSAHNLPVILRTLKTSTRLKFDYHNYSRSRPTRNVVLEPYLLRIFKQRWYVIGLNTTDNRLKTYALDRMSHVTDTGEPFVMPDDFNPATYFEYSFGIVVNNTAPRDIVLRVDHHHAKYLADLPLHPSQQQTVHDHYSLFRYKMQVTDDLVQELLSHGSHIVVEEPRELRTRLHEELKKSVEAYEKPPVFKSITSKKTLKVTDVDL